MENFDELIARLDDRYKKAEDCDREMDAVKKDHNELLVIVGKIQTTLDGMSSLMKTTLGAIITAIVGAVFYVITKGG